MQSSYIVKQSKWILITEKLGSLNKLNVIQWYSGGDLSAIILSWRFPLSTWDLVNISYMPNGSLWCKALWDHYLCKTLLYLPTISNLSRSSHISQILNNLSCYACVKDTFYICFLLSFKTPRALIVENCNFHIYAYVTLLSGAVQNFKKINVTWGMDGNCDQDTHTGLT